MKARFLKIVLPGVIALALCVAPLVLASSHAVAEGEQIVTHATQATHTVTNVAAHAQQHETVVKHGEAVEGGHEAAVEGEGHGGGHHAPMITAAKLKDLFWRTMNFMALVIILVKFLAKPIAGGLAGRRKGIQEEIDALTAKRDEAERSYKEFEGRLAGMEKEMEAVVEKAIGMAEDEKIRILKEAEAQAEDIKRQAEAAVQAAVVEAKRTLQDEVAEQAATMAEELIVKNLTPKDQVAITEQYLEKVGAVQ